MLTPRSSSARGLHSSSSGFLWRILLLLFRLSESSSRVSPSPPLQSSLGPPLPPSESKTPVTSSWLFVASSTGYTQSPASLRLKPHTMLGSTVERHHRIPLSLGHLRVVFTPSICYSYPSCSTLLLITLLLSLPLLRSVTLCFFSSFLSSLSSMLLHVVHFGGSPITLHTFTVFAS